MQEQKSCDKEEAEREEEEEYYRENAVRGLKATYSIGGAYFIPAKVLCLDTLFKSLWG